MRKFSLPAGLLVLYAAAAISAGADKGDARVPVLLELFTSEGCSDCPPADRLLGELDQTQPVPGAELIVLSEHVDYWDRLGWRDPFSSPQYTARQQEYASKFSRDGVYTPQLVVDGRFGFVGSDGREAVSAIQKAIREPKIAIAIAIVTRSGNEVSAHIELPASAQNPKGGKAILYVAIADNKAESHVTRGENGGRNLVHVGVVRVLKQAGAVDLDTAFAKDVAFSVAPGNRIERTSPCGVPSRPPIGPRARGCGAETLRSTENELMRAIHTIAGVMRKVRSKTNWCSGLAACRRYLEAGRRA